MVNIGSEPGRSVRKDKNEAKIKAIRDAKEAKRDAGAAANPKTQGRLGTGHIKRA